MVLPCLLFCPSALGLRPAKVLLSRRSSFNCASMIIPALHNHTVDLALSHVSVSWPWQAVHITLSGRLSAVLCAYAH